MHNAKQLLFLGAWALSLGALFGCKESQVKTSCTPVPAAETTSSQSQTNAQTHDKSVTAITDGSWSVATGTLTLTPDSGYGGLSSVALVLGTDFTAANIKSGATILGLSGSPNVVDTSAGDAAAADVAQGKKAYVDGALVTGTMGECGTTGDQGGTPNCKVTQAGRYLYASAYGGRSANGAAVTAWTNTGSGVGQGTTTVTGSIPDAWYSSKSCAFTDNQLTSGNICTSHTIFNVAGGATCQSAAPQSGAAATASGDICSGKYAWDASGVAISGNAVCGGGSFGDYMLSNVSRTGSTFPRATDNRATLNDEVNKTGNYSSANYRIIPDVRYDHDGNYNGYANQQANYFATVYGGRPANECGMPAIMRADNLASANDPAQLSHRMEHCKLKNPTRYIWESAKYGRAGESDWRLVSRTSDGFEVWRDERTKLLWSDYVGVLTNWCVAAGNNQTEAKTATGASSCATLNAAQNSTCADGVAGTTTQGNFKGGMRASTAPGYVAADMPSIEWRLPTRNDWMLAEVDGVRYAIATMNNNYWSATSHSNVPWYAWGPSGFEMDWAPGDRSGNSGVRCVGR